MTGWPWPLDAVQNWFEGLWNWISNAAYSACHEIWRWIEGSFRWLETAVNNAVDWVRDRIMNGVHEVYNWIIGAIDWVHIAVDNAAEWVKVNIVDKVHEVWNWILDQFRWAGADLNVALGNIKTAIMDYLFDLGTAEIQRAEELLVTNIAISNSVIESIGSTVHEVWNWIASGLEWVKIHVSDAAQGIKNATTTLFDTALGSISKWLSDTLSGIAAAFGEGLSAFFNWMLTHLMHFGEMVIGAVNAIVGFLGDAIGSLFGGFLNAITNAMMPGSPSTAIKTSTTQITHTLFNNQLKQIDGMFKSFPEKGAPEAVSLALVGTLLAGATTAFAVSSAAELAHPIKQIFAHRTIREILWMVGVPAIMASIITLPSAIGVLTPLRYALNERWTPNIAGAADQVRFELREVHIEAYRVEQLTPPPSAHYLAMMAKLGLGKYEAESYWAAHWVLPAITQLNEMLHRNIIDAVTWETFVRRNDLLPSMIPQLQQIIYRTYTRVDVRRMFSVGVLDDGELIGAYTDIGFGFERAKNMATFTKLYEALPDLRSKYKNGWITATELLQEMVALGLPEWRATELWQSIVKKDSIERVAGERDLTKSDILNLYGIGELTDAQALGMLEGIGYDGMEASFLLAIAKEKLDIEERELTTGQILKAYRYEAFTRAEAMGRLLGVPWTPEAAETLLRLEDIKLADNQIEKARDRNLTPSQILTAVKREIIGLDVGYGYLDFLGYNDWEIYILMKLKGVV